MTELPSMTARRNALDRFDRYGSERTFQVKELLPSGRVLLENFAGEHAEKEFEEIR